MKKYKLTGECIKDTEAGTFIPKDPCNKHYQAYLHWLVGLDFFEKYPDEDADMLTPFNEPDPEFTQEEIDARDKADRINTKLQAIRERDIGLFEMVLAMFEVGRTEGVWNAAAFPPEIIAMAQEWKTSLAEVKAINSELTKKGGSH